MSTEVIEDLEVLEGLNDVEEEVKEEVCIQKPKKPRSEKQIMAFNLVLEKRNENRRQRALVKEKEQEEEKKALETKIMKKAVSIKKKEIKKQLLLDDISDDDEPIESIKKKIVKSEKKALPLVVPVPIPVVPVKPKVIYM